MQDELGNRMKENYENRSKTYLTRRTPVIIRLDGKAFHSFTRGFEKPFDNILVQTMQETMMQLCKNIQGCVFGYTQSDEITLVLCDYKKFNTDAWFDYNVQKITSISASMATLYFNKFFNNKVDELWNKIEGIQHITPGDGTVLERHKLECYYDKLNSKRNSALFDSRCFNIPEREVTNCIFWRQEDATRNSIQSVGQAYFSHKELMNKSCNDIQDMLFQVHGVNWNSYPDHLKRGTCCYKGTDGKWFMDLHMPRLIEENRKFLDDIINCYEEE